MRDPDGTVDKSGHQIVRHLLRPLATGHFLYRPEARELVRQGRLTPYDMVSDKCIESRRIQPVTYPCEWTHGQLLEAASCTLDVLESATAANFELKDATAFNILFNGSQPEYCDHLSFQPIQPRYWWAYGQFLRHFVFPLALSRHVGLPISSSCKTSIDGVDLDLARSILGVRRWGHRIGLAFLQTGGESASARLPSAPDVTTERAVHTGLLKFLRWQLDGLVMPSRRVSHWSGYETFRDHYAADELQTKRQAVGRWLQRFKPNNVVDLGCNQGEFTLLAAESSQSVLGIDFDEHCIEQLRSRMRSESKGRIQTVVASLDDPTPARGWAGFEFESLASRLRQHADAVLALAVLHHLVIGRSIPVEQVADFLAGLCQTWLVIELIAPDDVKVQALCQARNRADAAEVFSLPRQLSAFARHFDLVESVVLVPEFRHLHLMRRRHDARG